MIIKKLTRQGNSAALIIDRTLMELMNIDQDTELKLTVNGRQLTVEALSDEERAEHVDRISKEIMIGLPHERWARRTD